MLPPIIAFKPKAVRRPARLRKAAGRGHPTKTNASHVRSQRTPIKAGRGVIAKQLVVLRSAHEARAC